MNEWRRNNAGQSTLGSRVDTKIRKVRSQEELKELDSPDQGGEREGNDDAVAQGIIVGHLVILWDGMRVLKSGSQFTEIMGKLTTRQAQD